MTTAQQLDERYGRTRRRRLPWIVFIVVVVVAVGAYGWMLVARQQQAVNTADLGFDVVDTHTTEVRFQITSTTEGDVVCALEALDEEFGIVGWKVLEIPASEAHSQVLTARIPTVGEATTGLVNACWVA